MEQKLDFKVPDFGSDSWGPIRSEAPSFSGLPFTLFSKSEQIKYIADWDSYSNKRREKQLRALNEPAGSEQSDEENNSRFGIVVRKKNYEQAAIPKWRRDHTKQASKMMRSHNRLQQKDQKKILNAPRTISTKKKVERNKKRRQKYFENPRPIHPSVKKQENWVDVKDIWFRDSFVNISVIIQSPKILGIAGTMHGVLDKYDALSCRKPYPLDCKNFSDYKYLSFIHKPATIDPHILHFVNEKKGNVYTTDNVLTSIMCCNRSKYSFDIVINKIGDNIFLDERSKNLSILHVDETSQYRPTIKGLTKTNMYGSLAREATYINHVFIEQMVSHRLENQKNFKLVHPFKKDIVDHSQNNNQNQNQNQNQQRPSVKQEPSCQTFVYKLFPLKRDKARLNEDMDDDDDDINNTTNNNNEEDDNNNNNNNNNASSMSLSKKVLEFNIVCRCTVDGYDMKKGNKGKVWYNIFALNQYDNSKSKTANWKKDLDTKQSTILLQEITNNNFKVARWATNAHLSGSEYIKLGFVSRVNSYSTEQHEIVGVKTMQTNEWIKSVGIKVKDGWSILYKFLQTIKSLEHDGRYIAIRDPLKQVIRIFSVTNDAFVKEDGLPSFNDLVKLCKK